MDAKTRAAPRQAYFEAIARKAAKEVLEPLRDEVLPLYRRKKASGAKVMGIHQHPLREELREAFRESKKDFERFIAALELWAKKSHLLTGNGLALDQTFLDDWIRPVVEHTLGAWDQDPAKLDALEWAIPQNLLGGPRYAGTSDYEWNPQTEGRGSAWDRIIGEFKTGLRDYMAEKEKAQEEAGREKAPRRFAIRHFDWLVLYQVLETPYYQIAKTEYVKKAGQMKAAVNFVTRAVKDAAELVIGRDYKSWLRKSPPGRPRKR
jgi:hypothetical protein